MEGELHKRRLQMEGAVGGGAKGPAPQIVRAGAVGLSLQEGRGQALGATWCQTRGEKSCAAGRPGQDRGSGEHHPWPCWWQGWGEPSTGGL